MLLKHLLGEVFEIGIGQGRDGLPALIGQNFLVTERVFDVKQLFGTHFQSPPHSVCPGARAHILTKIGQPLRPRAGNDILNGEVIKLYNELTEVDIRKMQEEIDYRMRVVRPKCIEDLQTARAFGDLSENYEYKAAKQELRRCDSRLRYLRRMIETAKVIKPESAADRVGLFDTVDVYFEDDDETEQFRIMTTLREDVLAGIISKESPIGKAIMNRRVGDRVRVDVSDSVSYYVQIKKITKGDDDDSLPIHTF